MRKNRPPPSSAVSTAPCSGVRVSSPGSGSSSGADSAGASTRQPSPGPTGPAPAPTPPPPPPPAPPARARAGAAAAAPAPAARIRPARLLDPVPGGQEPAEHGRRDRLHLLAQPREGAPAQHPQDLAVPPLGAAARGEG